MKKETKKEISNNDLLAVMLQKFEHSDKQYFDLAGEMRKGFEMSNKQYQNLAQEMRRGFENQNTKREDLAGMVARGFASMQESMATKEEVAELRKEMHENFKKVDVKLENQEESFQKVRQDILGIHDRFVTKAEFDTFVNRFEMVEKKVGVEK